MEETKKEEAKKTRKMIKGAGEWGEGEKARDTLG